MLALWVALLAAVWFTSFEGAEAQAQNYTVHSTVIFARTGDRTPLLMPGTTPKLTSLGSQQMFSLVRRQPLSIRETRIISNRMCAGKFFPPTIYHASCSRNWCEHTYRTGELPSQQRPNFCPSARCGIHGKFRPSFYASVLPSKCAQQQHRFVH
jgi:hypothetical protein